MLMLDKASQVFRKKYCYSYWSVINKYNSRIGVMRREKPNLNHIMQPKEMTKPKNSIPN